MESTTCCGMESDQRSEWNHGNAVYGIKPQEIYSIRASRDSIQRAGRVDAIPSLREPPKLAHSLRGTPTAAWITKKELLVDKSSFFVG